MAAAVMSTDCREAPAVQARVIAIAGLRLELHGEASFDQIGFQPSLETFWDASRGNIDSEIALRFAPPREEDLANTALIFDSEGLWQLREGPSKERLFVLRGMDGGRFYRLASFDGQLSKGTIVSHPEGKPWFQGPGLPDPFEYPLGEALTLSLLAERGRGILVHACGLEWRGRGYLLVGHSGAGKSTLARLARGRCGLLNDDRIVLGLSEGRPWIFGTPWHGDVSEVSAGGAPLAGLWIITHGTRTRARVMPPGRAAAELASRSFLPLWSAAGMERSLAIIHDVLDRVPCSLLEFTPDASALDEVLQ